MLYPTIYKQIEQQNHEPYFEKNWKHIFFFIQLSASFTYLFLHWSFLLFGDYQMILFSKKDKQGSMIPIFSPDVLQAQTILNPVVNFTCKDGRKNLVHHHNPSQQSSSSSFALIYTYICVQYPAISGCSSRDRQIDPPFTSSSVYTLHASSGSFYFSATHTYYISTCYAQKFKCIAKNSKSLNQIDKT